MTTIGQLAIKLALILEGNQRSYQRRKGPERETLELEKGEENNAV